MPLNSLSGKAVDYLPTLIAAGRKECSKLGIGSHKVRAAVASDRAAYTSPRCELPQSCEEGIGGVVRSNFKMNGLGGEADEDGNERLVGSMAPSFRRPQLNRAGVVDSSMQERPRRSDPISRETSHHLLWYSRPPSHARDTAQNELFDHRSASRDPVVLPD